VPGVERRRGRVALADAVLHLPAVPGERLLRGDGEILRVARAELLPGLGELLGGERDECPGVIDAATTPELRQRDPIFQRAVIRRQIPDPRRLL